MNDYADPLDLKDYKLKASSLKPGVKQMISQAW